MIDKGVQQKENAILKSYFEQQGMSEDEIKTAIGDYKSKKQTQAQEQAGELTKLQNANTELQSRLTNELLSKQAFNDCLDLGVDKNTIPYVIKSADFKDAIDDKGEIKKVLIEKPTAAVNIPTPMMTQILLSSNPSISIRSISITSLSF